MGRQTIHFFDVSGGYVSKGINPLNYPMNVLTGSSKNVEFSDQGIKVRKGYTWQSSLEETGLPVVALKQAVFQRNQTTYLIAQSSRDVEGLPAGASPYWLWVTSADLPTAGSDTATRIYDIGHKTVVTDLTEPGKISMATLMDAAIVTDGITEFPSVFYGALSADHSDATYPKAVLISMDGESCYDISPQVCDPDFDTVAEIGLISRDGYIAICSPVPVVQSIGIELGTVNTNPQTGVIRSETIEFDDLTKFSREDLRGNITAWVQDAGTAGHFDAAKSSLVEAGCEIVINGVTTYIVSIAGDGTAGSAVVLEVACGSNPIDGIYGLMLTGHHNIQSTVTGWTQDSGVAGHFNVAKPDLVQAGCKITIDSTDTTISSITGNGTAARSVNLAEAVATGTISAIYDSTIAETIALPATNATIFNSAFSKTLSGGGDWAKYSLRVIIPAADIAVTGTGPIHVTIQAADTLPLYLAGASIVPQGTGANGTTTPTILSSGANIAAGQTLTLSAASFTIPAATALIVILDVRRFSGWAEVWQHAGPAQATSTGGFYYRTGTYSFDSYESRTLQTVTGFTYVAGYCLGVKSIDIQSDTLACPASLHTGATTDTSQLTIAQLASVNSLDVVYSAPANADVWWAISTDQRTTWKAFVSGVWREIARNNSGTYQYKDAGGAWQAATINTSEGARRQAFAIAQNQMSSTAFEALSAANWIASGGIVPRIHDTLDFAWGLDGTTGAIPSITSVVFSYNDTGETSIKGYYGGYWSEGIGWTDGTVDGVSLGQTGVISYDDANGFECSYYTLNEIPGYWIMLKVATSEDTTISRVTLRAPMQRLANIGLGQPDICLSFVFNDVTNSSIQELKDYVNDNTWSTISKADIPMDTASELYVGYVTQFGEIEIIPWEDNNSNYSILTGYYWNGLEWIDLDVTDGTSSDGKTLSLRGKVSWLVPDDWKECIPLNVGLVRGYYVKLKVSATLSTDTAISEVRVYEQPDTLKKYRFASVFNGRLALGNRSDAPDQIDVSRQYCEYGFTGADSWSGKGNGIGPLLGMFCAWDNLFGVKQNTFDSLQGGYVGDFRLTTVEASGFSPCNNDVIIKGMMTGPQGDSQFGLAYLNQRGVYFLSGLQADQNWSTTRAMTLSAAVNWWDHTGGFPRLDIDNLTACACGGYAPVEHWLVWAVPMLDGTLDEFGVLVPQATNNCLIIYDLNHGAWLPPAFLPISCLETCKEANNTFGLYAGTYDGGIVKLFDGTTDDGSDIEWIAEFGWQAFDTPQIYKYLEAFKIYGTGTPVDLKGTITTWTNDSEDGDIGMTGHFNASNTDIDEGYVVVFSDGTRAFIETYTDDGNAEGDVVLSSGIVTTIANGATVSAIYRPIELNFRRDGETTDLLTDPILIDALTGQTNRPFASATRWSEIPFCFLKPILKGYGPAEFGFSLTISSDDDETE